MSNDKVMVDGAAEWLRALEPKSQELAKRFPPFCKVRLSDKYPVLDDAEDDPLKAASDLQVVGYCEAHGSVMVKDSHEYIPEGDDLVDPSWITLVQEDEDCTRKAVENALNEPPRRATADSG